jgi:hypothetical protein
MRWPLVPLLAMSALIGGCGVLPVPPSPPPVDQTMLDLNVSNGTTLPVAITVNGADIGVVRPGGELTVPSGILPPMPWTVEARTPSGRLLTTMTAHREDIHREDLGNGATSMSGAGARVDLSCGRLDLWVGVRPMGPVPGPGTQGDCDP